MLSGVMLDDVKAVINLSWSLTIRRFGCEYKAIIKVLNYIVSNIEIHSQPDVLLLAAGMSTRMGAQNKLLLCHEGRPLIAQSAGFFRRHFDNVYIVTGFEADKIKQACGPLDVTFIYNPNYQDGLESSFRAGILGLPDHDAPLMTALADQIFLNIDDINAVKAAYQAQGGRQVIIPQYKGQRGHPVMFPPAALAMMRAAQPIMTGRDFIQNQPDDCHFTVMTRPHCILDIDTADDARQHLRPNDSSSDTE